MIPKSKRSRTSSTTTCEPMQLHPPSSDYEALPPDEATNRVPQAERKRELERNRRNLVNIRFLELEKELVSSGPRSSHPIKPDSVPSLSPLLGVENISPADVCTKPKRLDKEAVLKEAAQRIATLKKELNAQNVHIASMTDEIIHLRAEKLELRSDKAYLRSELENSRNDAKRLRADNIGLWQALKRQSVVKNYFAPDLAKIPADVFTRQKQQDASHLNNAPVNLVTSISPVQVQSPSSLSCTAALRQAEQSAHVSQTNQIPTNIADSILMHQTPEEICELFANYVPGVMMPPDRIPTMNSPASRPLPQAVSMRLFCQDNHQLPFSHLALSHQENPLQQYACPSAADPTSANPDSPAVQPIESRTTEKMDDPLSDVAYCV